MIVEKILHYKDTTCYNQEVTLGPTGYFDLKLIFFGLHSVKRLSVDESTEDYSQRQCGDMTGFSQALTSYLLWLLIFHHQNNIYRVQ